jgi:hypothetical protein
MALLATATGCEHGLPVPNETEVYCSQKLLITPTSPWTQDWEGCVEGWRTIAGVDVVPVVDATSTAPRPRPSRIRSTPASGVRSTHLPHLPGA